MLAAGWPARVHDRPPPCRLTHSRSSLAGWVVPAAAAGAEEDRAAEHRAGHVGLQVGVGWGGGRGGHGPHACMGHPRLTDAVGSQLTDRPSVCLPAWLCVAGAAASSGARTRASWRRWCCGAPSCTGTPSTWRRTASSSPTAPPSSVTPSSLAPASGCSSAPLPPSLPPGGLSDAVCVCLCLVRPPGYRNNFPFLEKDHPDLCVYGEPADPTTTDHPPACCC